MHSPISTQGKTKTHITEVCFSDSESGSLLGPLAWSPSNRHKSRAGPPTPLPPGNPSPFALPVILRKRTDGGHVEQRQTRRNAAHAGCLLLPLAAIMSIPMAASILIPATLQPSNPEDNVGLLPKKRKMQKRAQKGFKNLYFCFRRPLCGV